MAYTLQSVLIKKPKFPKATQTRSMVVEALSYVKRRASQLFKALWIPEKFPPSLGGNIIGCKDKKSFTW